MVDKGGAIDQQFVEQTSPWIRNDHDLKKELVAEGLFKSVKTKVLSIQNPLSEIEKEG